MVVVHIRIKKQWNFGFGKSKDWLTGDYYIQAILMVNLRHNVSESCSVTMIFRVTAIYRAAVHCFDCSQIGQYEFRYWSLFGTVSKDCISLIYIQIQNSLVSLVYYFQQFITQSNGFPLEAEQRALAGRVLSHISVHHFSALFNRIAIRWIQIIILWFLVNCAFFFAFEKER